MLFSLLGNTEKEVHISQFKKYYSKLNSKDDALKYQNDRGDTLMMQAIKNLQFSIVKFLTEQIREYEDLDIQNDKRETALHIILKLKKSKLTEGLLFKELIDKGASVEIADDDGKTVLDLIYDKGSSKYYDIVGEKYEKHLGIGFTTPNSDNANHSIINNDTSPINLSTQGSYLQMHHYDEELFNLYSLQSTANINLAGEAALPEK